MKETDISRSANTLVKEHGFEEAQKVAAKRAATLRRQGDVEGFNIWALVTRKIISLKWHGLNEGEATKLGAPVTSRKRVRKTRPKKHERLEKGKPTDKAEKQTENDGNASE